MRHPLVKVLKYADDLVLYSTSRFHLQQALGTLASYVNEVGLTINSKKTEAMKFRRGGRLAARDKLTLAGQNVEFVNNFTYLGITLSTTGTSFTKHIEERSRKALMAAAAIKDPQKLSLSTALALFDLKVAPVASYGIERVWKHLSLQNLVTLDRAKSFFLKRVLCLHRSTKNRLVYLLADSTNLVDDICLRFALPETPAYKEFTQLRDAKRASIEPEFFETPAMKTTHWKGINVDTRHLLTRHAIHGFHHDYCTTETFHEPHRDCLCKRCHEGCSRYHQCPAANSHKNGGQS